MDISREVYKLKSMFSIIFLLSLIFVLSPITYPKIAFANDFIKTDIYDLISALNGTAGLEAMFITIVIAQSVIFMIKTKFNMLKKIYKIFMLISITMLVGVFTLRGAGLDMISCLTHATTLSSMQVFVHQLIKCFKGEK